jgi:predicted RNA-binding Zn ribbon-like protein
MAEAKMTSDKANAETEGLCLDFANTAEWHASGHPTEQLQSYAALVSWAQRVGILTDHEAGQLSREATRRPSDAAAVLERAISLREALYRILSAVVADRPPGEADLAILNGALSDALARVHVVREADSFAWRWAADETALDRVLWPVARSAADLLTSEKLARVGQCADDRGCGWLFLDMSRNRSRRWCDMKDCGNRAKAKRHYVRKRKSTQVAE